PIRYLLGPSRAAPGMGPKSVVSPRMGQLPFLKQSGRGECGPSAPGGMLDVASASASLDPAIPCVFRGRRAHGIPEFLSPRVDEMGHHPVPSLCGACMEHISNFCLRRDW